MNLFSPILRLFGIGALSNKDTGPQYSSIGGVTTDAGINVTDERAMRVSAVWACVQYITNSVCSLPLGFYEKTTDGRRELTDGYLVDLFSVSPNALMKPRDFRKAMTFQLCLWSNAYAEIFRTGTRITSLVPLRPGRMTPVLLDGELTYHYNMEQGVRVYSKESIFHMKGFGTEGIVGLDRVGYSRSTLGLSVSADTYAARQFANGGRADGGRLMFDDFLTEKQREQARDLYAGMSETAFNKGKLWILEGGVKYEADTLNPDTMQMLETRKMQLGEIARFFGVPEVMIGASTSGANAWPASFEQQLLSFLTFTLQDYIDEWETAIKDSLIPMADRKRVFADHDVTGFIKMDSQAKANIQSTWVQNGLKTRNEIRKINNDPPIDGGDDLTVQVNLTPVDQLQTINSTEELERSRSDVFELKHRLSVIESEGRIIKSIPEPMPSVFNISTPDIKVDLPQTKVENNVRMPRNAPAPIVNVNVPKQAAPTVNVEAPTVNVEAPDVTVNNDVKTPEVNVDNKLEIPAKRAVAFKRDRDGKITSAEVREK